MRLFRALKNIRRGKGRSALTLCGVAVGVFAVVVISGIGVVGTDRVTSAMVTMGINSALVEASETGGSISLTDEDVTAFSRLEGVNKAMPLMASPSETKLLDVSRDCYAWGVDRQAKDIISLEAIHGRLIGDGDVETHAMTCVIDEVFATQSYGRSNITGKKIRLLLEGGYYEFEIVGVAKSGMTGLQNMMSGIMPDFVYIPYTTMQDITGRTSYDKIALLLDGGSADENLTSDLTKEVNQLKSTKSGLTITNFQSQKGQLNNILSTVTTVLSLIAGISLVVSGITVMTTMLVSVGERTREIGIKKSIGAKNKDIMWEFLLESVLLTAMGSITGIALGTLVCAAGCIAFSLPVAVPIKSILLSFCFSSAMGALFGVYPAMKAARLNPIEALRT